MNMKPVDMQIALPKLMDTTHPTLNPLSNQRMNNEHDQLAHNQQQLDEQNSNRSTAVESASGETIREDMERDHSGEYQGRKRKRKQEEADKQAPAVEAKDPYKGKHIDFKA